MYVENSLQFNSLYLCLINLYLGRHSFGPIDSRCISAPLRKWQRVMYSLSIDCLNTHGPCPADRVMIPRPGDKAMLCAAAVHQNFWKNLHTMSHRLGLEKVTKRCWIGKSKHTRYYEWLKFRWKEHLVEMSVRGPRSWIVGFVWIEE